MQWFQEKHEVARANDIVVTDQPHRASVGMHQGNVRHLPDNTKRWMSNLPDGIQEVDLVRQSSEVQESQSSFGRGQRVKKKRRK